MEFSKRGRLYRRVAKLVAVLLVGGSGLAYWLYRSGPTEGGQIALGLPLLGGLVWAVAEFREAGRPFRLRIDELGITLHDRVLPWQQIAAIGLEYPEEIRDSDTGAETYPHPLLICWPVKAAGAGLKEAHDRDGMPGYELLRCADMTEGIPELSAALVRYAGARFITAPGSVGPVVPQDRPAGPEHWYEYLATDDSAARLLGALLLAAGCGAFGTAVVLGMLDVDPFPDLVRTVPVPLMLLVFPTPYVALIALGRARRHLRNWRRPLRVRVGTPGLTYRRRGAPEHRLDWAEISVVRLGPRPDLPDGAPWLIVWAVPGTRLGSSGDFREDGLWGRALTPAAALPDGPVPLAEALRQYSGGRFR